MKKSKLRNIIRESIKELMTEQTGNTYYRYQGLFDNCTTGGIKRIYTGTNNQAGRDAFYQAVGSPQPGQVFGMQHNVINMGNQQGGGANLPAYGCWVFLGTSPNYGSGTHWSSQYINGACAQEPGGCLITSTAQIHADCQTCYQFGNNPPNPNSCPGWSNYNNWVNTFTSLPNFTSSNPNQPCQFLCQRNTQWSTQIQNVGPNWAAQLQCKIDKVQDLMNTHNCASSNAPAC